MDVNSRSTEHLYEWGAPDTVLETTPSSLTWSNPLHMTINFISYRLMPNYVVDMHFLCACVCLYMYVCVFVYVCAYAFFICDMVFYVCMYTFCLWLLVGVEMWIYLAKITDVFNYYNYDSLPWCYFIFFWFPSNKLCGQRNAYFTYYQWLKPPLNYHISGG